MEHYIQLMRVRILLFLKEVISSIYTKVLNSISGGQIAPDPKMICISEESCPLYGPLVAKDKKFVLSGKYTNKICLSYSIIELKYMSNIIESIINHQITNTAKVFFDTTLLKSSTSSNNNIFHIFHSKPKYLESLLKSIVLQ